MRRAFGLATFGGLAAGAANWAPSLWPLAWLGVAVIAYAVPQAGERRPRLAAIYASQVGWLVACSPYLPSTLRLTGVTASAFGSVVYALLVWAGASVFMAAPIALASELTRRRLPALLWLPPAWLVGEKLRDHFGRWSIDWLYSQSTVRPVLALLATAGWWLTAWACLAVACAAGDAAARRSWRYLAPAAALGLALVIVPLPRGGARLDGLGVITLRTREAFPTVSDDVGLSLLIWPEAALPLQPLLSEGKPAAPQTIAPPRRGSYAHLLGVLGRLRGAVTPVAKHSRHLAPSFVTLVNAVVALEPDGNVVGVRGKSGLFPITEEPLFGVIGDASRAKMAVGEAEPLLEIAGLRIVPLICVEAMRRPLAARGVARGGTLIAILASDIGLRETSIGQREMLAVAVMRAVEYHVPVVRASIDGTSAIIDADGSLLATSSEPGVLRAPAP